MSGFHQFFHFLNKLYKILNCGASLETLCLASVKYLALQTDSRACEPSCLNTNTMQRPHLCCVWSVKHLMWEDRSSTFISLVAGNDQRLLSCQISFTYSFWFPCLSLPLLHCSFMYCVVLLSPWSLHSLACQPMSEITVLHIIWCHYYYIYFPSCKMIYSCLLESYWFIVLFYLFIIHCFLFLEWI